MKKTLFIIPVLFIMYSTLFAEEPRTFSGLVIAVTESDVVIKTGPFEQTFYRNENTVVTSGERTLTPGDIRICQRVRVVYRFEQGADLLVSVEILKGSYCFK